MDDISDFIPHRFFHNENAFIVTNAQGQILWVNPALSTLCGFQLDEIRGKKPGSLLQGPETDPIVVDGIRQALRAGVGCVVELLNYHKDGHPYPVHIEIIPVKNAENRIKFFAAIERQFTEKEIREIGRQTLQLALHNILQDLVEHLKKGPQDFG